MKTFWVRISCDPGVEFKAVDVWTTGYDNQGWAYKCFAVRAKSVDEVRSLLADLLGDIEYSESLIEEQPWETYGHFAGPGTRFPMDKKYLHEKIDGVKAIRARFG